MQRALSVRPHFAELILRGKKVVEYRSRRTLIRGRVLLYSTKALGLDAGEAARLRREHGIDADRLPRGFIVGSVELVDCREAEDGDGYEWLLAKPQRAGKPYPPERP